LEIDTSVWVTSEGEPVPGQIQASSDHPRLYVASTPTGLVRQNRQHLNCKTSEDQPPPEPVLIATSPSEGHRMQTRSQTGTEIRPPKVLMSLRERCGIRSIRTHAF